MNLRTKVNYLAAFAECINASVYALGSLLRENKYV